MLAGNSRENKWVYLVSTTTQNLHNFTQSRHCNQLHSPFKDAAVALVARLPWLLAVGIGCCGYDRVDGWPALSALQYCCWLAGSLVTAAEGWAVNLVQRRHQHHRRHDGNVISTSICPASSTYTYGDVEFTSIRRTCVIWVAFNAQKFTESRDPGHAPFSKKFSGVSHDGTFPGSTLAKFEVHVFSHFGAIRI